MYLKNDLHIFYYIAFAIIGLIIGQITGKYQQKIIDDRKSKMDKKKKKKLEQPEKTKKYHYLIMILTSVIYILLLYFHKPEKEVINYIGLIQNMILTPFLLSIISIDRQLKIIPNRLVLTLLEIGIVLAFVYGMYDINIALDRLVGGFIGIAIFLGITLLANLISGTDTMGYGDIKFVGALGLYFGMTNIMILSVISFIIGAIIAVILMLIRRKKMDEYIAFGPFISLAAFTLMFVQSDMILYIIKQIFTLGM